MYQVLQQSVYKFILLSYVAATGLELLNDVCELPNGKKGTCMKLQDCATVIGTIPKQNRANICGYDKLQPIICCDRKQKKIPRAVGAISQRKCKEIYDVATGDGWGGVNASAMEYKHMAALGYGDAPDIIWACGGSLISTRYVMTAAHCIESHSLGRVQHVRLGDLNLRTTTDNADPQDFGISRIIVHPDYVPPNVYNDIAIIELDADAKDTLHVRAACLNTDHWVKSRTNIWTATGWGITSYDGPLADHLQEMFMHEVPIEECRRAFRETSKRRMRRGIDEKTQLCAGAWSVDTCQGDSGGPLQVPNFKYSTGYTVVGITSFGKQCGLTDAPGIYTRVSYYIGWIESVVWPEV